MAQQLAQALLLEATRKGIEFEFIQGNATNIEDLTGDPRGRRHSRSGTRIEINPAEEAGEVRFIERYATVVALTFGSPKKALPGEEAIGASSGYCKDLNHPLRGHVLHPEMDLGTLPEKFNVVIAGSKLSAVDALVVLYKRGYFNTAKHWVTVVSPNGRFAYPHEIMPCDATEYEQASLLRDVHIPEKWRQPRTARDLAE